MTKYSRYKILVSLFVYIVPALCQFAMQPELRADVSFGENNDRFDITDLVQEQKQFEQYLAKNRRHRYKQGKKEMEVPIESNEVRRSFSYPGKLFARRWDGGYALHDDIRTDLGGSIDDFEKGLDNFRNKNARRQGWDRRAYNFMREINENIRNTNPSNLRRHRPGQVMRSDLKIPDHIKIAFGRK